LIQVRLLDLSRPANDFKIRDSLGRFFEAEGFIPHLICTTATSAQVEEACQLAQAAKELVPSALRVIGGPHVTVLPEEFLENSEFDVACLGEGVETLADLALVYLQSPTRDLSAVKGIVFRDAAGAIHRNPARSFCFSLDEYPHPSESLDLFLEGIEAEEKRCDEPIYVLAGFGCPRRCAFCASRPFIRAGSGNEAPILSWMKWKGYFKKVSDDLPWFKRRSLGTPIGGTVLSAPGGLGASSRMDHRGPCR
jgi:radical SAM superfamily enzyme YgiQ (UPF0313 family)